MTNIIAKAGGLLPDPEDSRDYDFEILNQKLTGVYVPPDFMLPEKTPISDQGRLSTCAGNVGCDALEYIMPRPVQMSRLFAYWAARATHGATQVDGGTYLRAVFKQMSKIGAVPESAWPYIARRVNSSPSGLHFLQASENRLQSYYGIKTKGWGRVELIKKAIVCGYPVAFGMVVSEDFLHFREQEEGYYSELLPPFVGGHAMLIVGYEGRDFKVRNSWGRGWGDNGYCWMTDELIAEKAFDLWVPTMIREVR